MATTQPNSPAAAGTPSRVVFMGTPQFAVPSLQALIDSPGTEVVAVFSQPDRPAGRGRKLTPSPVTALARAQNIPVHQPTSLKKTETQRTLANLTPHVIIVAAYGKILPQAVLDIPPHGCINVHASLLPRHRGASPIAHAILHGDAETGVGIMRMEAGLDTGPVYAQRAIPIPGDATCGSLTDSLASLGAQLLSDVLPEIVAGRLQPQPQDDNQSTYAPLLTKADGELPLQTADAQALARQIRAFHPWPGCALWLGDNRIQILAATPLPPAPQSPANDAPGHITGKHKGRPIMACKSGALRLERVKPAGKKEMDGAAWMAGRGIQVGDRLTQVVLTHAAPAHTDTPQQ